MGKSKPPSGSAKLTQRGDERRGSTLTGRQLSGSLSRPGLPFAAKRQVRGSYPASMSSTVTVGPGGSHSYCRPEARSGSVLRRPLPPHSTGLRPVLSTKVADRPEGSQMAPYRFMGARKVIIDGPCTRINHRDVCICMDSTGHGHEGTPHLWGALASLDLEGPSGPNLGVGFEVTRYPGGCSLASLGPCEGGDVILRTVPCKKNLEPLGLVGHYVHFPSPYTSSLLPSEARVKRTRRTCKLGDALSATLRCLKQPSLVIWEGWDCDVRTA